ncbi:MAG: hypothetical protein J7L73_04610, partial [Anaerolineales bacterium]|nr:hypothetical protein [Anaerolineales bacterium]
MMTIHKMWSLLSKQQFTSWLIPTKKETLSGIRLFILIIFGGIILAPIVSLLPMLGLDWLYFFNDPNFTSTSLTNAYPPFASLFINLLTWMNWRHSLALLNSLTLVTIALATWKNGGKYGSIMLTLMSPAVWFVMWIGHPDALCLLGLITGFIPLALIKPQLTIFSMFSNRKLLIWTILFLIITLVIWPGWIVKLQSATIHHRLAFGWFVTGWPILVIGVLMLLGAGKDPYRLMAAGLLASPYLM